MAEASAASDLYRSYSEFVRNVLRSDSACEDIEDSVLSVFISAIRRIRYCDLETRREFEQELELLARQEALVLRHRPHRQAEQFPEMALSVKSELLNTVFMQLDGTEREILLRASVLGEAGIEIAARLDIATADVERAKAKARRLYQNIHPCNQ